MAANLIEIKNLTYKVDGCYLLRNISLKVDEGDSLAILGKNGSGKSLLIDCLLGNINDIEFEVKNIFGKKKLNEKERIGVLFDEFSSIPLLKVKEIIDILESIYKKNRNEDLFEDLKIELILNKYFKVLSNGERRRLGIYSAFFHEPELVILDEPSNGLDPVIREILWKIIKESSSTIIFTTHLWNEIETVADKIVFINNGTLICEPMKPQILMDAYIPYIGKVVISSNNGNYALKKLIKSDRNIVKEEGKYHIYFKDNNAKQDILKVVQSSINSFSLLPLDIKDAYFIIKEKIAV